MNEYGRVKLKIGEYMKANGITTYKLVKDTELRHQTVKNYRDGDVTRIDLDILAKICKALKVEDIKDIIEYEDNLSIIC